MKDKNLPPVVEWLVLTALLAVVVLGVISCGGPAQYSRVQEMPQSAVGHPQFRAGAQVLFVNRYQATHSVVYLYRGALQPTELFANMDGRLIIFKKYIDRFVLDRAYSQQDVTVKSRLLDVNAVYTALVVVYWDIMEWAIFPATPEIIVIQTDSNPMATTLAGTDRRNTTIFANRIVEVAGTDEPARGRFVFRKNLYPNQWVWGIINRMEEAIGGGR